MLTPKTIHTLAQRLLAAEKARQPIPFLSNQYNLDMEDAYRIQEVRVRLKEEPVIGYKLGFTSNVMRQQMRIASPNYGMLTYSMMLDEPLVPADRLIHPRIEPEIAVLLKESLPAPVPTLAHVYRAIDVVMPALEIVDTRYITYQFTLQDNTADNSSAAYFIAGWPHPPAHIDLRFESMIFYKNSDHIAHGVGAEVMGNPLKAIQWLASTLHRHGKQLQAGDLILTGGLTQAFVMEPGDTFTAAFAHLGTIRVTYR